MIKVIVVWLTMMVIIALIWLVPALKQLRRHSLFDQPFPLHWVTIIQQNLPIEGLKKGRTRSADQAHTKIFIAVN